MGPTALERMDDRMDAVEAALRAALTSRHISRSYQRHYGEFSAEQLQQGVVQLISSGESGYQTGLGMVAREGTHNMLLVCYLVLDESSAPQETEAAELALIEEIKAFVRTGVDGTHLVLDKALHSRQQEHPYGWVVAYIEARPTAESTY